MKYIFIAIFLLSAVIQQTIAQNAILEQKVTVNFDNVTLAMAVEKLYDEYDIFFTYSNEKINMQQRISIQLDSVSLSNVLYLMLRNTGITFSEHAGNIVLFPEQIKQKSIFVSATILESGTEQPISYSAIQLKSGKKGTISDINGFFELEITEKHLDDTLIFSSLGYKKSYLKPTDLLIGDKHTIYLQRKEFKINEVQINASRLKSEVLGNFRRISIGSLYMDTHGQQTALYISNENGVKGIIKNVGYYLSRKGNTDAPFRVRIYKCDSVTGKPGDDLLDEILVAKPKSTNGWYKIDISQYKIAIPDNGFFVAMEGVFPNDYDFYTRNSKSNQMIQEEVSDDENIRATSITYGQRLGYSRFSANNTWHYSLSHTWFQLDKKKFNVLILAEIIVTEKPSGIKRIFKFLQQN